MESKHFYINRRNFLKGSTAALALSSFGAYGLDLVYSDKKWRVGLIGTGWYGTSDLFKLIQVANVEVVSLCDADKNHLQTAAELVSQRQKSGKKPRLYRDYRKMLAEKDLDIVLIGTPDHWHALQAIEAIKSGAHVYLQKPISVDVLEGEAILATARKYGKTVQIGTQRKSTPHLVECKKNVIDTGMLGKISHVEMCCYYHMRANGNHLWNRFQIILITKCGPALHLYGLLMGCPIPGGGALLWSMVMVLWVICAYICLIPYVGCLIWVGPNGLHRRGGYMFKKMENPI